MANSFHTMNPFWPWQTEDLPWSRRSVLASSPVQRLSHYKPEAASHAPIDPSLGRPAAEEPAVGSSPVLRDTAQPSRHEGGIDAVGSLSFGLATREAPSAPGINLDHVPSASYISSCGCSICRADGWGPNQPLAAGSSTSATTSSTSPAAAPLQTLANYLRVGFWNEAGATPRAFNLTSSGLSPNNGILRYNFSGWSYAGDGDSNGLSAPRKELVRDVLDVYQATLGIKFLETSASDSSVDLFFGDNQSGSYAYSGVWGNGVIKYSIINVASGWFGGSSSFDSYTVQTLFHEIGHALGLGHQGLYNGSSTYPTGAKYANDSWQLSMMSYFSQSANTTTGASYAFLQTPMSVDWLALNDLYGSYGYGVANAFSGDTIYGIDTNISASTSQIWNEFSLYAGRSAYTIVDGGGYDTLNVSNFSANQLINLVPTLPGSTTASVSNIGGRIGNLTLAVGTIIEAAIAGSGNDTMIGNAADNAFRGGLGTDTMDGGQGSDLYLIGSSSEHPAAEINDTGTIGIDELRFDSVTSGDTLTLFSGDRGLERVTIGTGSAARAVLSGMTALNINAAAAANALSIQGNAGSNTIIGSAFVDSLDAGEGSDIYIMTDSAQHSASEIKDSGFNGSDELRFASTTAGQTLTVFAADLGLERVSIGTGMAATPNSTATTALNIDASLAPNGLLITGNAGANRLIGSSFNDTLKGAEGADTLTGGLGSDMFLFDTPLNPLTSPDRLTDFNPSQGDLIILDRSAFAGLGSAGSLDPAMFSVGEGFTSNLQRLLYSPSNGLLTYDSNGSDAAGFTAPFAGLPLGLVGQISSLAFRVI